MIRWNGSDRDTKFINSTRLSAVITTQDIAAPGTAVVTVFKPSSGGVISNSRTFTINSNSDNWTFIGAPRINNTDYPGVEEIVVDKEDQDILYVTVYQTGLLTSRNGGVSWTLAIPGTPPFGHTLISDPNTVNRIFYGQKNNLYVSIDRGLTWDLLHSFDVEPTTNIVSLEVSRIDPHTVYAGLVNTNGMFYRSQDDGLTWEAFSYGQTVGLDNFIPWDIAEDPLDGTLYVGVELGNHPQPYRPPFLRSQDSGQTWENLVENTASILDGPIWHVTSIAVHPDDQKVYAISEGVGLYTSMDQGVTWARTPYRSLIGGLLRDPFQDGRLFAGSVFYSDLEGGVYISTDDGLNFYEFGLQGKTAAGSAITGDGSYLYVASYQTGIYYTPLP